MNFVMLSPHFPPHYYQFCVQLQALGANVLGLADEPYDNLIPELKNALNEYYYVPNMHSYDDMLRALGYFTFKWGKIDGLDSHNEYWMDTEARLRTDFNIDGIKVKDLPVIKRKSLMKKMYKKAGVDAPPGMVIRSAAAARRFAAEVGFPVIVKPDIGVGAANTYCFTTAEQLETFLVALPPVDYYLEKFVDGHIQTFDGLTDQNGDIVFFQSMEYSNGVMETVNEDSDVFYYTLRSIPLDLEQAGRRIVKAYSIKKRFFHFEFFHTPEGKLVGLEVNMRPPGGLTTDMMNFSNDIDIYYQWANVMVHNRFTAIYTRPYHCAYIGRKWNKAYAHTQNEILSRYHKQIMHHEALPDIFAQAMGNYGYLVRSPDLDEIKEIADFILTKKA